MMIASVSVIPIAALETRWTFAWGPSPKFIEDGSTNSMCKPINHSAGQEFEFDKPNASTCVLHLYTDDHCAHQAGVADKPWWKISSKDLHSFQIMDCPDDAMPRTDKIALGVGIEIGLPACLSGIFGLWINMRRSRRAALA